MIWAGTVCSPCVNAYNNRMLTCQNNLCMQHISVDEVFEKVCEVFDKRIRTYGKVAEAQDNHIWRESLLKTVQTRENA